MDEYQIEVRVEKATDRIDARYMRGEMNEQEYREEIRALDNLANEQYKHLRASDYSFSGQV